VNVSPTWKYWGIGSILFKANSILIGKKMYKTLLLPTQMVLFQVIHMFLQFSWIVLLGTKSIFLPLERACRYGGFLSHAKKVILEETLPGQSCFWHRWYSSRGTYFYLLHWIRLFFIKWMFPPFENAESEAVFLSKANSILIGKQCEITPATNRLYYLKRYTCFYN
jgi:hypothetical protein